MDSSARCSWKRCEKRCISPPIDTLILFLSSQNRITRSRPLTAHSQYLYLDISKKTHIFYEHSSQLIMSSTLAIAASGAVFGGALFAAGVTAPSVVIGQMQLGDLHMLKVFVVGSASSAYV